MKRMYLFLLLLLLGGLWPLAGQTQVTVSGSGSVKVVPNDPTTGTVLNGLAKVGPTGAIRTTPSDATVPSWIVTGGAGTTLSAVLAVTGDVSCTMDATASNTRGMLVVVSPTNNQQCHAIPVTSPPSTGYAIGTMADNATTVNQPALVSAQLINYQAGSGTGVGTITGVDFTAPSLFTKSGVPVSSGAANIVQQWQTQAANCVVAGPSTGGPAIPTCRPLAAADLAAAGVVAPTCAGDLTGTAPNCVVAKASGAFAWPGDVTPTALSGSVNNYNGCDTALRCRLSCTVANCDVGGFQNGAAGRVLDVCNVGVSGTVTLLDQGSGTSGPNQVLAGSNLTLRPNACKPLMYDATAGTTKWRPWDSVLLEPYGWKSCQIPFGSTASGSVPVPDDDDVIAACGNNTLFDWQIVAVKVYANVAGISFKPKLTGGADITASCTVATAGAWTNCPVSGTPIVKSFTGADRSVCSTGQCTVDANRDTGGSATSATYGWIDLSGPLK